MMYFKKYIFVFVIFAGAYTLNAQMINSRFTTFFYAWERYDTTNVSQLIVRSFQMAQLEVVQGNYSFHSNFYGAMNFNKFGDDGKIYLNNLFLKIRNIGNMFDVSLGRIPIFFGVSRGLVDGAFIKASAFQNKMSLSVYGGENIKSDLKSTSFKELKDNYFIGGQITGELLQGTRIGLSYMNRNIKRESYTTTRLDTAFKTVSVFVEPDVRAEQALGFDARYFYYKTFSLYGKYDYDINLKRNKTVQVSTRFDALDYLTLSMGYSYKQPRIFYNSFFNIFPTSAFNEFEGGLELNLGSSVMTYGKFSYILTSDDASTRLNLGVSTECINIGYVGYAGYAGELTAIQAQFIYPLFNRIVIPSISISFDNYRFNEEAPKQELYSATAGGTYRPMKDLSFDTQVQWARNPVASDDVRIFVKINYWFSHNLGLF